MRTKVYFDGHELTRDYYVSDLKTSLLPRRIGTQEVPGRDGTVFTGSTLGERSIKLTLTVHNMDMGRRQAASRALASILAVDEPKPLAISIDDGLYYMAIPKSDGDATRWLNSTSFDVEFACPDPVAYGEEKVVTVPNTGTKSVTFTVGGTYPTQPTVAANIVSADEGDDWRLALEDGTYLYYEPVYSGAVYTESLVADCAKRTLKLDGNTRLLIPSADWLIFEPGEHTLTLSGDAVGGAATVTYRERWL